jgi:hypothetical protein
MSSRKQKWIVHDKGDTWDLSRGGRFLYEGLGSQAEAFKRLKAYFKSGETVVLEEKNGLRTNITEQLKKKGVI